MGIIWQLGKSAKLYHL